MIARLLISRDLETRKTEINKILVSHLTNSGMDYKKHPDLLFFPYDSKLGILEARKIKEHFSLKPYSAKGRAVVLEDALNLTVEAQNALLKTLEELPKTALFILGVPSDAKLLPTILSRCQIITMQPRWATSPRSGLQAKVTSGDEVEKLIKSSIEERFEYIEKLKNREEFLHTLVSYFHQNLRLHLEGGKLNFIKELLRAEKWAAQNVNIRAILEYLMLVMPQKE